MVKKVVLVTTPPLSPRYKFSQRLLLGQAVLKSMETGEAPFVMDDECEADEDPVRFMECEPTDKSSVRQTTYLVRQHLGSGNYVVLDGCGLGELIPKLDGDQNLCVLFYNRTDRYPFVEVKGFERDMQVAAKRAKDAEGNRKEVLEMPFGTPDELIDLICNDPDTDPNDAPYLRRQLERQLGIAREEGSF